MMIFKDPERARELGLIGAKAQLAAGTADWPTFVELISQSVAIGGAMLFAFFFAWVFGREFAQRTVRARRVPHATVGDRHREGRRRAAWSMGRRPYAHVVLGLGIDSWLGCRAGPAPGPPRLRRGSRSGVITTDCKPSPRSWPASVAVISRPRMGGPRDLPGSDPRRPRLGGVFPWAVPALVSGAAGPDAEAVSAGGVAIVAATAFLGLVATLGVVAAGGPDRVGAGRHGRQRDRTLPRPPIAGTLSESIACTDASNPWRSAPRTSLTALPGRRSPHS